MPTQRPKVVAHRGASQAHAGNSWAAFQAAVAEGADIIECDVQVSADGVLLVRHDLALDRKLIADMTATEIRRIAPDIVPFDALMDWRRNQAIGLLVEIKDRAAVPALVAQVPDDMGADIVVAGFDAIAVSAFKGQRPSIATSLMIGSVLTPDAMIALARRHRADGVHPCWEARAPRASALLNRDDVKALRDAGLAVTLWHEERPDELSRLIGLGADAICTDTPAGLRALLDGVLA